MNPKILHQATLLLCLAACTPKEKTFLDLETIDKNEAFRSSVKTGAFAKLSSGYTYYEFENRTADTLLVLVHGFSVPSYIWDSTYNAALKRGYGVLRYDNFGRGNSDNPNVVYDVALFSNQLKELLDELHITKQIHLIGLSDGGRTISAFASQYPEKIKSLVYVDAVGFETLADSTEYPAQVSDEEILTFKQNRYTTMAKSQMTDFYDSIPFRGWDKQYERLMQHKGFMRALISTNKNRRNLEHEHRKIVAAQIPTFAIWGENDTVVQLAEMKADMMARIPNIRLIVLPQTGHLPQMEKAKEFNAALFDEIVSRKK